MAEVDTPHVAMLGGDERELILAQALLERGMRLTLVGYPDLPQLAGAARAESAAAAAAVADVVVAPMSNTDEHGVIQACLDPRVRLVLDEAVFRAMGAGKTLFIGVAKPIVERLAAKYKVRVVELAELDEIAILNSIPTAEGAIARAMSELPITVHGSRAVVIGFGRCAITLARMLGGIGARVLVIARDRGQLARAREMGFDAGHLQNLPEHLREADVVFNTVPALVLDRPALEALNREALIIDIASAPGGTDFGAARELGIKAFLELGIPGKVAPKTAGAILAQTVPDLIMAVSEERA